MLLKLTGEIFAQEYEPQTSTGTDERNGEILIPFSTDVKERKFVLARLCLSEVHKFSSIELMTVSSAGIIASLGLWSGRNSVDN